MTETKTRSSIYAYNSLLDPHLCEYFSNVRRRRYLIHAGLITRRGEVIPETLYRRKQVKMEQRRREQSEMEQQIIAKSVEVEREDLIAEQRKLEEINKLEHIRRIKAECNLRRRQRHELGQSLIDSSTSRSNTAHSNAGDLSTQNDMSMGWTPHNRVYKSADHHSKKRRAFPGSQLSPYSPRPPPPKQAWLRTPVPPTTPSPRTTAASPGGHVRAKKSPSLPTREETPEEDKLQSQMTLANDAEEIADNIDEEKIEDEVIPQQRKFAAPFQALCQVTLHYFGSKGWENLQIKDEVLIKQHYHGGNTLTVFQDFLLPADNFTFYSRRQQGFPFSLTIYINGVMSNLIRTCCEYKNGPNTIMDGAVAQFGVVNIAGPSLCYRCRENQSFNEKEVEAIEKDFGTKVAWITNREPPRERPKAAFRRSRTLFSPENISKVNRITFEDPDEKNERIKAERKLEFLANDEGVGLYQELTDDTKILETENASALNGEQNLEKKYFELEITREKVIPKESSRRGKNVVERSTGNNFVKEKSVNVETGLKSTERILKNDMTTATGKAGIKRKRAGKNEHKLGRALSPKREETSKSHVQITRRLNKSPEPEIKKQKSSSPRDRTGTKLNSTADVKQFHTSLTEPIKIKKKKVPTAPLR